MIRGVSVFRLQLESMFAGINDVHARYLMRIYRTAGLDMVDVMVGLDETQELLLAQEKDFVKIKVTAAVRNLIGVTPNVLFANTEEIARMARGVSTVVDERSYR